MGKQVKTYDPKQIHIIIAGVPITGFADGTFVKISYDEDAFTKTTGADGETARSKSNNRGGAIELTLMQSSSSNDILSALAERDRIASDGVFPALVEDALGTSLYATAGAWVKKHPDASFGKTIDNRAWMFDCADLEMFTGASGSPALVNGLLPSP